MKHMRYQLVLVLLFLTMALAQADAQASATYRYAEISDYNIYLITPDGKGKLVLAKDGSEAGWEGLAVSPSDGTIVSAVVNEEKLDKSDLYAIDPATGKKRLIVGGKGYFIPDHSIWLNGDVLVAARRDIDGMDKGIHAINIRTGAARQVVIPVPDNEFFYDKLVLSPSKKLLATSMTVTGGSWISVNDIATGKSLWRTNPNNGLEGFTDFVWSADSKSLFVAFYKDNEMASDSPGGLWKFGAATGKKTFWKYAGRSIESLSASADGKLLTVQIGGKLEVIQASNGKLTKSAKAPKATASVTEDTETIRLRLPHDVVR